MITPTPPLPVVLALLAGFALAILSGVLAS